MFDVKVIEKISKNGVPYKALEVIFPSGYSKVVYLDKAEQYLCEFE